MSRVALIIGAGPAGLTAAYELLEKTDILPVIVEKESFVGGISRTVDYKGNKIDIGGHRFFSKSDRVMRWWQNILPIQGAPEGEKAAVKISYQNKNTFLDLKPGGPDPDKTDRVMLLRNRKSRIFFLRKFFNYPISLSPGSLFKLGLWRSIRMTLSYIYAQLFPMRPEKSLREFFINRFGKVLYVTFFKSYTEKVWGVPCQKIPAEWGAQRVKSLSLGKAVLNQIKGIIFRHSDKKNVPTSLIEKFLYPKFGPGQMWEEVTRIIKAKGAEIHFRWEPVKLFREGSRIAAVEVRNMDTKETKKIECDYLFSTMPIKELIECFEPPVPDPVRGVARRLIYRDMVVVGLLLKTMTIKEAGKTLKSPPDNWIYIQERDVRVGRLQIFNNWSPYLVKNPDTVWVGMEYFCDEGDIIWNKSDADMRSFATEELIKMRMITRDDVLDGNVLRVKKTYPAYLDGYKDFGLIREFTDRIENLYLVGRNGMHRYNNQDHSMLTAMTAVENIVNRVTSKDNIWSVNMDDEYHEEKKENM